MKLDMTALLAVYGAVVSSFVAGWNVFRDLRDRPSVKVRAKIGYIMTNSDGRQLFVAYTWALRRGIVPGTQPLLKLTFTNSGRRVITLSMWGAVLKAGSATPLLFCPPLSLPKSLTEGESVDEFTTDLSVLDDKTKRIWVQDSTERSWYLPRHNLKSIRKDRTLLAGQQSSVEDKES
jgi:hypothetical protein